MAALGGSCSSAPHGVIWQPILCLWPNVQVQRQGKSILLARPWKICSPVGKVQSGGDGVIDRKVYPKYILVASYYFSQMYSSLVAEATEFEADFQINPKKKHTKQKLLPF